MFYLQCAAAIFLFFCTTNISALSMQDFNISAILGTVFTSDIGGGVSYTADHNSSGANFSGDMSFKTLYLGAGGSLFIDAKYVEIGGSFFWCAANYKTNNSVKGTFPPEANNIITNEEIHVNTLNIAFGVFFKYPFEINENFFIFPVLGTQYYYTLLAKDKNNADYKGPYNENTASDFSAFWFNVGAGADIMFSTNIFLRIELLYGIRIVNQFELKLKDDMVSNMAGGDGTHAKTILGHGPSVKIAFGFVFTSYQEN